jgi:glycine betaine/choline ABC-type transport system substrate-binding protein
MRPARSLRLTAACAATALALAACNGDDGDGNGDGNGEAQPPESLTLAGPPECEERITCYQGLVEVYGMEDLGFESVQEASARIAALDAGDVDVILLFSTDAVIGQGGLTVLEEPEQIVPPENVVPVLADEVIDTYGDDVSALIDEVGEEITTEALIDLNTRAGEGTAPDEIAAEWLEEIGFDSDVTAADGDLEIVVASFNFPESVILAEIYAAVLEEAGYPVDRQLDLGARELIFPELADGSLHLLPEYVGSALTVGFGEDAPEDLDSGIESLREAFAQDDVSVLEPTPAENTNVFVVTDEFAEEHGLSSLDDLAGLLE